MDHCSPTGPSDLQSCSLAEHQTGVDDDKCDSHCSFEIGSCKQSTAGNCPTLFQQFTAYMDEHLNLEVAEQTDMDTAYNNWKVTITGGIGAQDETLLNDIVDCAKQKCLKLTTYDVREALNGAYQNVVRLCGLFVYLCLLW